MNTTRKQLLLGLFIGTLGFAGLAQCVYVSQPQLGAVVPQKQHTQAIEPSDGDGETNDDAKEQQEAAQLQPLAKITAPQAQQAAEVAQKAKASEAKLGNEAGNLVYTVTIGQQVVAVDAGNAHILDVEGLHQENGKPEVAHPRSSIQVSQSHDRDAETNDDG